MGVEVPGASPRVLVIALDPGVLEAHHPHLVTRVEMRQYSGAAAEPDVAGVRVQVADLGSRVALVGRQIHRISNTQCCYRLNVNPLPLFPHVRIYKLFAHSV